VSLAPLTVCLPTDDRGRAAAFYRSAFDLPFVGDLEDDGLPEPLQLQINDQTLLMLIPRDGFGYTLAGAHAASPDEHSGFLTIGASDPSEVDRMFTRCVEAGATALDPPNRKPWGYMAMIADPDGHLWLIRSD
jgi:predicted lactoylglutathione lyase